MCTRADWPGLDKAILPPPYQTQILLDSKSGSSCYNNNNNNKRETYTGITKNTCKERYDGHNTTFNNRDKSGKTTLAAHIWKLKDKGANYNLSWSIIE